MEHLNSIWSYATTEWLRLTLPSPDDKTRSRWPIHPLWGYLSSVDWETPGGPLSRRYSPTRIPGDDWLFTHALSVLVAYMARERIDDLYDGNESLMAEVSDYFTRKANFLGLRFEDYLAERIALKGRQFNTLLNNPQLPDKLDADALNTQTRAYRRAAKGGD
jgi:hypothetical protein